MRKLSIFLAFILVLAFGQGAFAQCDITISNVDGLFNTDTLFGGQSHTIEFYYQQNCGSSAYSATNGFTMYSPDGAAFGPVDCDYTDLWNSLGWSNKFANLFEWTGSWTPIPGGSRPFVSSSGDVMGFQFVGVSGALDAGLLPGTEGAMFEIYFQSSAADDGKHICIDSASGGLLGTWIWANVDIFGASEYPVWAGEVCWVVYDVPNLPPVFVDGCDDVSKDHCVTAEIDLAAYDPEFGVVTFTSDIGTVTPTGSYVDGPNTVYTATWTYNGLPQTGTTTPTFTATDPLAQGTDCSPVITSTNAGPAFDVCPVGALTISTGDTKSQLTNAVDDCDGVTYSVVGVTPAVVGAYWMVAGELFFTPDDLDADQTFTFTVEATDGDQAATCDVQFSVIAGAPYFLRIEKVHDQIQGMITHVDIILEKIDPNNGLGGFDILVAYDPTCLAFRQALEGSIYELCEWEYFNYRFGADGNCGNGCPSGLLRVVGIAEQNDGANHPICDAPDPGYVQEGQLPVTLASLEFLVSNDRVLECQYCPIRFFWYDCGDNVLSNHDGSEAYISLAVFDYDNETPISDPEYGFPGFFGAPTVPCLDGDKVEAIRNVDMQNGGVDIVCADSIDARGDINMNGLAYEIADAVMFTNYFIEGPAAFGTHYDGSVAASDANADGIPLTVSDLVFLIRVVVGDALPYPKLNPVNASFSYEGGIMSVDAEMGAAYVVIEGNVEANLLATNMEMKSGVIDGNTHLLISKIESGAAFSGDFVAFNGRIITAEFSTYDGQPVNANNVPKSFRVDQNYPNPFNPTTVFGFALPNGGDWTLTIYNVTGQVVEQFSGNADPGYQEVLWDASHRASGIYFYKVVSGEQTETKKAILLK